MRCLQVEHREKKDRPPGDVHDNQPQRSGAEGEHYPRVNRIWSQQALLDSLLVPRDITVSTLLMWSWE